MASQLRPESDPAPFQHPVDAIEPIASPPFQAQLVSLADKHQVAEIFIRLFADCIPMGTPYKGGRRWRAGYNRMVAIAYVVAPELFGSMTQAEVSGELGIDETQFRWLRRDVEAQLATRALNARERRAARRA